MFWDDEAPGGSLYWAAQREFQNAAVLQMMEASLNDRGKVRLFDDPETGAEAIENLYAFSEEARQKPRIPVDIDITAEQVRMLRTRKCFGWLKLNRDDFSDKNKPPTLHIGKWRRLTPQSGREYFAVVYEFIEEDELDNEEGSIERKEANRHRIGVSMGFLWGLGFEFADTTILDNWKNGVLIDLSDIVFPLGVGRHMRYRRKGNPDALRRQAEIVQEEA